MKNFTLITGASSGIGLEIAKLLGAEKHNLILTARSEAVLQQTAKELSSLYGIEVLTFGIDLSTPDGAQKLYNEVLATHVIVDHLVNNAGSGSYGNFIDLSLEDDLKMMQLNMTSLVTLSKLFGRQMALRKEGRIMNVASLLSFLPFPYYSVYSATKAFVLAFSETLAAELEGSGVVVTTLCPGPVDTGFTTACMANTNAYKSNKPVDPKIVAQEGVKLLLKGKGKKIVGFQNWFVSNLPRVTPDVIMMKIKKQLASQRTN
jgi:short-subunit dehydrogenase